MCWRKIWERLKNKAEVWGSGGKTRAQGKRERESGSDGWAGTEEQSGGLYSKQAIPHSWWGQSPSARRAEFTFPSSSSKPSVSMSLSAGRHANCTSLHNAKVQT